MISSGTLALLKYKAVKTTVAGPGNKKQNKPHHHATLNATIGKTIPTITIMRIPDIAMIRAPTGP